jgi:hypothetical protein
LLAPFEPLPNTAFERPQHSHAMRLPAPGPILKLNQQSNIPRSEALVDICRPDLPPCNFAVVPAIFPAVRPASGNRAIPDTRAVVPRQKGTARIFAAPSSLEICHIALAGVTLLATIASAAHELDPDSYLVIFISHQNLTARVSTHRGEKFAGAVRPSGSLADENTERKANSRFHSCCEGKSS